MPTDVQDESRVTSGYAASIPAAVRRRLGIEPGDIVVRRIQGERLSLEFKKARRAAFADFEPYDIGVPTDAALAHDEVF